MNTPTAPPDFDNRAARLAHGLVISAHALRNLHASTLRGAARLGISAEELATDPHHQALTQTAAVFADAQRSFDRLVELLPASTQARVAAVYAEQTEIEAEGFALARLENEPVTIN